MLFSSKIPLFLGIVILMSCIKLPAQEQLGLRLDNYSGANAITLNPAANATSAFGWDINLIGFGISGGNNMAYIEKARVGKVIRNLENIGPDPAIGIFYKGKPALEFNFKERNPIYGSLNMRIMGPSIIINLRSGHAFGLFTGVRAMVSSYDIPKIFNPYEMQRTVRLQTFAIDPFKIKGLTWSEWGINYAYTIGGDVESGLTIGANMKFMKGFQGFFINNYVGTNVTRLSNDTLHVDTVNGELGFTNNYNDSPTKSNGKGTGFDIGALLTTIADDDRPYEWRFGASILDIGSIKMTQNTEVHQVVSKDGFDVSKEDVKDLDEQDPLHDIITRLNQKAFNAPLATLKGNNMIFGLPAALQLQADYAFTKNLFLNALVVQRLSIGETLLRRDNLFAVTPRYESRWLGASMPISLYNYKQMRVGLVARLAFLTIGTEHLMSFISNSDLYGSDFYFALKLNPFKVGSLSMGKGKGGNWGKKKKVSCYKF